VNLSEKGGKPVMRQRLTLFAAVIALCFGLALPPAGALQATDPASLITNLVSEAIANIKQQQQASDDERASKFRALLEAGFDIPRISRFVLGRFWNAASDRERQQFTTLFENWVVRTYSSRFRDYSGQTIKVTGTRPEGDTSSVVLSQFINPNAPQPAKVEWHVRKEADGSYKVVDVSVEGVSMALTQRDEIAAVADRNGGTVGGLNKALEERLAANESAPAK
jgi:phospholipid transport system substrate-binding protein